MQGNVQHNLVNTPQCKYTGTQKMQLKKKDTNKRKMSFVEYRNLPNGDWMGIKKHKYSDNKKCISVICYNDKRKVTLISTKYHQEYHGCECNSVRRTHNGRKQYVEVPNMVKYYTNKKVAIDVGDKGMRDRQSFADNIKCFGCNQK